MKHFQFSVWRSWFWLKGLKEYFTAVPSMEPKESKLSISKRQRKDLKLMYINYMLGINYLTVLFY